MPKLAMSQFAAPEKVPVARETQQVNAEPGFGLIRVGRFLTASKLARSGWVGSWAILFTLFLLGATLAPAQIDTGSIVGTVKDSTGAVVSGAKVTITNEGTGVNNTTTTNPVGEYVVPSLKVGTYSVSVEKEGFQKVVHSGIILNVQDRKQVDATLALGAVTQQVSVTGDVPLIQTESAAVGQVVAARTIVDLPLNGRQYDQLALLVPGVTVDTPRQRQRGEGVFDANGNWGTQNNYMLDGVDNNSFSENIQEGSVQVVLPSVDSLSEFKLQTRTYDAEFGRNAGSIINATTKSGTNQIHGDVYEFLRNSDLDANNFFLNRVGQPIPEFRQNQFGFTIGGPVYIPKLYHGRNKTFWFGNYEGTRIAQGTTSLATVPTPLMRQGNFSEINANVFSPTAAGLGQFGNCIQNKAITSSCIDTSAQKLLSLYPLPNTNRSQEGIPGSFKGSNYIASPTYLRDMDQGAIRVDQTFSNKDNVFGRFTTNELDLFQPGIFYNFNPIADGGLNAVAGKVRNRGTSAAFAWTHVFSSNLLNEFRAGFNRMASHSQQIEFGQDVSSQFGSFGVTPNPVFTGGLPTILVTNYAGLGAPQYNPQNQFSQVWQYRDGVTYIRGSHTFKAGGEWRRDANSFLDLCCNRGSFSFSGQYTGNAFADFLLGIPTETALETLTIPHLYQNALAFFIQDTWKVNQKLTFNYGVRYEYVSPPFERDNRVTNFNPALNGGQGGLFTASPSASGTYERTTIQPWKAGIVPRLGLAYQLTSKLVFRAGGGYFIQGYDRHGSESMISLNPPFLVDQDQTYTPSQGPPFLLSQGFPAKYIAPVSITNQAQVAALFIRAQAGNLRPGRVGQASANFEYSVAKNTLLEVGWVGNNAHRLWRYENINQGILSTPGQPPVLPFPTFSLPGAPTTVEWLDANGNSNYNALQVKLERRFSSGFSYLLSYAWSKGIADAVEGLSTGQIYGYGRSTLPQDVHNMKGNRGLFLGDTPHRFVSSVSYSLPLGKGHRFASSQVGDYVLGGWQVNAITTYASGQPIDISMATDLSGTTFHQERANCVGNFPFTQNVNEWLNPANYGPPARYNFGTCGVTPGPRTPGLANWDASLFKHFAITEQAYFQLRAEFFNLANTSQFLAPTSALGNPAFGQITGTQVNPRQIQFALKFYF
ncbi:MAG TPA: TonB-dependent receptor [Bryobacteraceae bacterium]|nr:TonB-dependent receptor [Bryobacteraceae bacterium]